MTNALVVLLGDQLDGSVENEHFCLETARGVGLPVVSSRIMQFEDQVAIVVERYDRSTASDGVARLHQEDAADVLATVHKAALVHPVVESLSSALVERARSCAALLAG